MKPNTMVYTILIFGLIMSITIPHLITIALKQGTIYENEDKIKATGVNTTLKSGDIVETASNVDLAVVTPAQLEEIEEPKEEVKAVVEKVIIEEEQDEIVYDNLTMTELIAKLNKNLNSTLSGTGNLFAKYSIEYGVDPYLALAIALHETGCKWSCSSAVKNNNNVGGMYANGSLIHFDTLEEGIQSFIKNLKVNYYDKGLTTPEQINTKYATNTTWYIKINEYIEMIKNS